MTKPQETFMCVFDISNLFTYIPSAETIQIYADSLYNSELASLSMDKNVFIKLINVATTIVEISFDNIVYK